MKTFAAAALGAVALAATLSFSEPAAARSGVDVYVGPGGVDISVERYREYCRDGDYRRRHWDHCGQFYGGHLYPNAYERHQGRYRHWDRVHRRWYWDDNNW